MGLTKTQNYTAPQIEIATLTKALGHPARMAIFEHLLKVNTCICNDIVSELPLSQPTVSQHLRELKNANIIQGNIEGNAICYCLNPETINKLKTYFTIALQTTNSKCC